MLTARTVPLSQSDYRIAHQRHDGNKHVISIAAPVTLDDVCRDTRARPPEPFGRAAFAVSPPRRTVTSYLREAQRLTLRIPRTECYLSQAACHEERYLW